jgi:TonB family protein
MKHIFPSLCIALFALTGCASAPSAIVYRYQPDGASYSRDEIFQQWNTKFSGDSEHLDYRIRLIEGELPAYPLAARRTGIEGLVRIRFMVNETGLVESWEIESSPHNLLSSASIAAIKTWRFEPIAENGRPVGFARTHQFVFSLSHALTDKLNEKSRGTE